jgi:uncharacterized protein YjbI with pentapeptide repeats
MTVMTLIASGHCSTSAMNATVPKCNFNNADLENWNLDGLRLSEATFDNARMAKTTFRGTTMVGCTLTHLRGGGFGPSSGVPFNADFSGATMSGSNFSFRSLGAPAPYTFKRRVSRRGTRQHGVGRGEHGRSLRRCTIGHPFLLDTKPGLSHRRSAAGALSRRAAGGISGSKDPCTFQGANLDGAEFNPSPPRTLFKLYRCRFDIDPESGKVTSLVGATLARVQAQGNDFSDADFTDAVVQADFGTGYKDPSQGHGAVLRRANLTRTNLSGSSFIQADLSEARFVDLTADKMAGIDLRFAKLRDATFPGSDLTKFDFGPAAPFIRGVPLFAGAKLSDGTNGAKFSGQKFPDLYDGFRGLDLRRVDLIDTELFGADLEGTILNEAKMVGANLNFSNLRGRSYAARSSALSRGKKGRPRRCAGRS